LSCCWIPIKHFKEGPPTIDSRKAHSHLIGNKEGEELFSVFVGTYDISDDSSQPFVKDAIEHHYQVEQKAKDQD